MGESLIKNSSNDVSMCSSCVGRLSYKTAIPCRYCKYNKESYFGRDEKKMIDDYYRYANPVQDDDSIPF